MKKILIVDDQPEVRELVRVTLEIGPYQIFLASNGAEALQLARTGMPDLLLLGRMGWKSAAPSRAIPPLPALRS